LPAVRCYTGYRGQEAPRSISRGLLIFLPHTCQSRGELAAAALGQESVARAPVNLVLTAVFERSAGKYDSRASRYGHLEIGHAVQNIYLQVTALGLGTVVVGAFVDDRVQAALLHLQKEEPLAIMPVGRLP